MDTPTKQIEKFISLDIHRKNPKNKRRIRRVMGCDGEKCNVQYPTHSNHPFIIHNSCVNRGFATDLASCLSKKLADECIISSVLHDYHYQRLIQYKKSGAYKNEGKYIRECKKEADKAFAKNILTLDGGSMWASIIAYIGVRLFGWTRFIFVK